MFFLRFIHWFIYNFIINFKILIFSQHTFNVYNLIMG